MPERLPATPDLPDRREGTGGSGAVAARGAERRRPSPRQRPAASRRPGARAPAAELPVARVAVDVSLAHLDRPFDYLVPQRLSVAATPGCRVRVRFSGQLTDGYLLERRAETDHPGRLSFLERVVSPEPVLTAEIAGLARAVADRYAGTLADVLRLAVPPRHAAAESAPPAAALPVPGPAAPPAATPSGPDAARLAATPAAPGTQDAKDAAERRAAPPVTLPGTAGPGPWAAYPAGPAFLAGIAGNRAPRAAWSALPGENWALAVAAATATAVAAGRGVVIVVPDAADLTEVDAALGAALGAGRHVALSADLGPAERYRRWLAVLRGTVRVVAGTRAAMFAPVRDLGLVVLWDDGDDLHAERRAPYPHAREVLALRAHRSNAAALVGGFSRTAEMTQLVASGWARPIRADRAQVRRRAPAVRAAGDDSELARDEAARAARLPSVALRTAREALARGPVLVQVPRRGYLAAIGCGRCRARALCPGCGGPLGLDRAGAAPRCRWCGAAASGWRCPRCHDARIRAFVTGAARTAEELGRAFPSAVVRTSGGDARIARLDGVRTLVVATPGAEPAADGGYAAALLLDAWALLGRADLRSGEEALRRWMNAAALVRPGHQGGVVVVLAGSTLPAVQALVRWDPVTYAERELAERAGLGFPPAVRMASVTGSPGGVQRLLGGTHLPEDAAILGPVPAGHGHRGEPGEDTAGSAPDSVRALVRVPRHAGARLARALQEVQALRSAHKDPDRVRVQLDPLELV